MTDHPTPYHDAAAILTGQLAAKDAELASKSKALHTISEAAAAVDFWLDDLKALADAKDATGAAYWGILEGNATIRKAAREAL